jgi:hypothetical protein
MSPGDFLRAVWPAEGIYCLATPFTPQGSTKALYAHATFDDIGEAVSHVLRERGSKDIYFAVHTLKKKQVWNPQKVNPRTGELGANETRTHANMAAARCFFFDIDVSLTDPTKYDDQTDALAALKEFCTVCHLPRPLVISSGGGLHVYWLISDTLDSGAWRAEAAKLRQIARHYGLKIDGSRTTDVSSVLRVCGTYNYKDPRQAKAVDQLVPGSVVSTGVFIRLLDTAITEAGLEAQKLKVFDPVTSALGSNISKEYDGPPVSLAAVATACKQMQRLIGLNGKMSEPEWYHGVIGVGRFLENGHRRVHQMSHGYPGYDEAATAAKIRQHEDRRDAEGNALGPTSCAKLAEVSGAGDEPCVGCPFAGKVQGPLGAARYKDPAPPPVVKEIIGVETISTEIPQAPKPYTRMKGGGIAISAVDKDGNESNTIIYPYDLYPVRRLVNASMGVEQHLWHVQLPREEAKEFVLDADALYDPRKFVVAISNQGLYPNKGHVPYLQDYMVAYISELQRLTDADAQSGHLGWSDEYTRFILPDKILYRDGKVRPAMLAIGAQRSSAHVFKKGEINRQVELLNFFSDPRYIPNQFYILGGLGAPLFHMTGHHGVVINASGAPGSSKSTSLYTAASFWGQPELYPINGTNNGATVRGRNERVTVLANLPICVDEITHMPVRDAVDLAMSVTQPGHRIRLGTDGVERAGVESHKATIMLTTANSSLHGALSTDNAAGTAGSMRVFEIMFKPTGVHQKHEADDFLHDLKTNFGHIGELFMAYVVKHHDEVAARIRAVVKEVDKLARIQSSERFWSATVAVIIVAGEIANQLGILNWNIERIKKWAVEVQIPYMRGVVVEEYTDPLATVADYLALITSNIIVMQRSNHLTAGNLNDIRHKPTGALLAHYDTSTQICYVMKKGFKDHCSRIGASSAKILDDLHTGDAGDERIVMERHTRRTLGAGTEYATAQVWCFALNMQHPEVSGKIDLEVIEGGGSEQSRLRAV